MKRTGKRLGALLLALVMVLSLVPVTALAARTDDDAIAIEAPDAVQAADAGLPEEDADGPAALMAGEGPTNAADSRYDIALTAGMLSTKSTRYDDWATRLLDDDGTTYWEARWEGTSSADNVCFPTFAEAALEVNFTQATEVLGFRYQTKSGSNGDTNGAFVQWKIETKATQNGEWTVAKTSDDSTKWTGHTAGGWKMAKLDAAAEVWGIRLVPQSFKNGAASDAAEQTTDNTEHAGNMSSENMSCAGLRVFGATAAEAEPVDYTIENIEAGKFDVGYNGFTYSPTENGVTITASAPSYQSSCEASKAIDGTVGTNWHTNWGGGSGATDMASNFDDRYIQIDLDTAHNLSALRYLPKIWEQYANGIITRYEVKVCTDDSVTDSSTWTSVAVADATNNWDAAATSANASGENWYIAYFNSPVSAKHVRLYAVTAKCNDSNRHDNNYVSAREVRLVEMPESVTTSNIVLTVKDTSDSAITGATVTCGDKTATETPDGTYTISDLIGGTYNVTVAKDRYKTQTVAATASADASTVEVTLYPPLSGDPRTAIDAHKWDYPIWTESTASGNTFAYSGAAYDATNKWVVNGGSVDAYSWASNGAKDLPPWAALDGELESLWHAKYGNHGQAAATGNVGSWYEFTLGQKTKIIGVWVYSRTGTSNSDLASVAVRVNATDDTLTSAQWAALPDVSAPIDDFTNGDWQFVELSAPVEAKQVRIYAESFKSTGEVYFVAKELRVVMDPETSGAKQLTGTVKSSSDSTAIAGATLTVANHSATSGSNGTFDLGYLPAGTYSVTASAPGYATKTENVEISTDPVTLDWKLTPQPLTVNVTVNGPSDTKINDATVILESSETARLPVANVTPATSGSEGVYTLDATHAGTGTYVVRVSHPDYNVATATVTLSTAAPTATAEVTLTARAENPVAEYDFSEAAQVNDFVAAFGSEGPTIEPDADKGAMKITFKEGRTGDQHNLKNLIFNKKFVMHNGVVEFDVTPGSGSINHNGGINGTAFGAVMRAVPDGNNLYNFVHAGYMGTQAEVGMRTHVGTGMWSRFANNNGGGFAIDVTRRTKITLTDTSTHTIEVDGETASPALYTDNGNAAMTAMLNGAGYWGFNAVNANNLVVYIDNVKVYRNDAQNAVTIEELSGATVSAAIVTELDAEGTALTTENNTAYAGDTVKVTANITDTSKVLGSLKVTKTGEEATVVTATKQDDGSFTFTMPDYPVTITAVVADKLTADDVTVSGANYGTEPNKYARVGNTLTVTPANGVSYQWQYSTDGETWTDIADDATGADFTLTTAQYGSTHTKNQVHVVVTGDGATYAGTVTSAPVDVQAALKEVTGVVIARATITMIKNDDDGQGETTTDPANTIVHGNTTTLTATVSPDDVTGLGADTVTWTVTGDAVTLSTDQKSNNGTAFKMPITAVKNGTATVTATAKAADGATTKSDSVTITVVSKVDTISVKNGEQVVNTENPLTLYANTGDEGHSKTLTVTVNTDASNSAINWSRKDGPAGLGNIVRNNDGSITLSATNDPAKVGEVTIQGVADDGYGTTYEFPVRIVRKLANTVTIGGTLQATKELEVDISQLTVKPGANGKGGLTYTWYRANTANADTESATEIHTGTGESGKKYPAAADDVTSEANPVYLFAVVSANAEGATDFYYEGSVRTADVQISKLPAPAAPQGLDTTEPSSEGGNVTVTGLQNDVAYEYKEKDTENAWAVLTAETPLVSGKTYQVRIRANATTEASQIYELVTKTYQDTRPTISVTKGANGNANAPARAEAETTVTLTITPDTGYELDEITVKKAGTDETVDVQFTDVANSANKTFTMPSESVTIHVTFKKIQITITHALTNITCSLSHDAGETAHTVNYGGELSITLTPDVGYGLPEANLIKVTKTGTEDVFGGATKSGNTISFAEGVLTENITITAKATPNEYTVQYGGMQGLTAPENEAPRTANHDAVYNGKIVASANYHLPASITVTTNGQTLALTTDYTYDSTTGAIQILAGKIKGNVVITANADHDVTEIISVSINEPANLQVGTTLTATVAPDGAQVNYQWIRVKDNQETNIGQNQRTYQLATEDLEATIKVKVTGKTEAYYTGTKTSDAVGPVVPQQIAVTGVSLNKTTTSIVFGGTDTLTVTFEPANATNKTVTWGTSNANVATVADGVVTATGVGEATITVRTANGREDTCAVTVTQKDLTNVSEPDVSVRVGGALELGGEVTANLVPADAATGASYAWSIVDANGDETSFGDNTATVTLPNDSQYLGAKVMVVVSYGGNYTGTKRRITEGTITGQGQTPSHSVVIASGIENGSVTADKTTAQEGETVTLTIAPATGYELDTLTVTGFHGTAVDTVTKVNDTTYTFDMPRNLGTDDVVNVTATFKLAPVTPTTHTVTFTLNDATLTVVSGGTAAGSVVTVSDAATLTFKLTPPTGKVVKAVKDGTSLITPVEGVYTISNITVDKTVTVELEAGSVTPPDPVKPDTTQLAAAIADANAAMENITISDKPVNAVEKGVVYYPQPAVDALTKVVKDAEAVLNNANATQEEVDAAVTTLNNAVTAFGETKKIGAMDDADLVAAIEAARTAKAAVYTIDDEPANVKEGILFVTTDEMKALNDAIDAAQEALNDPDKDQTTLDAAKDALATAMSDFTAAKKTGTSETAEAPVVDTTALDEAIAAAEAAKKNVVIKDADTDPATVNRGTKFVTQEVMDALDAAIAAANTELETPGTDGSVSNAVDALYAALEDFNAATKIGTKQQSTSSSTPSTPVFTTETETKPDGTKVTTVTDNRTGTVTETTEKPDGSKEVVETKKDGTITETKTDPEGAKTEKVTTPEKDVTITVTDKDGEELAKVELPAEIPETETRFEDVPEDHWANQAIHSIAALELVEGVGGKKYAPADSMTRGALATVLHRLSQGKTDYELTFQDVAATKFYAPSIAWAAKAGVVKGFNADIFAPDQIITREQLAVMLARYAKLIGMDTTADANAIKTFSDAAQTGDWAVDGMAWCVSAGILQGKDGNRLDPTADVSRAEAALMLDRFIAAIMK